MVHRWAKAYLRPLIYPSLTLPLPLPVPPPAPALFRLLDGWRSATRYSYVKEQLLNVWPTATPA